MRRIWRRSHGSGHGRRCRHLCAGRLEVTPNLTLSGGLRFETQNAIHDHGDWAPRIGFAWGIGGAVRARRKRYSVAALVCSMTASHRAQVLNADRFNGITQQQYSVSTSRTPAPCPFNLFPAVPRYPSCRQRKRFLHYRSPRNCTRPIFFQSHSASSGRFPSCQRDAYYLNSRGVTNLCRSSPTPRPSRVLTHIP